MRASSATGLYTPVFGPPPAPGEMTRRRSPNWDAPGTLVPYIVFMTGRCGSTWLMHLLRGTGLCGTPQEFFNEGGISAYNRMIGARDPIGYLEGLARRHGARGRFGFEIDVWRFFHLLPYLDFEACFPAGRSVFFWMTRRDILAQAYSFASAKVNGRWHVFSGEAPAPSDSKEPDDTAIWREIHRLLLRERRMTNFFAERGLTVHTIAYEDLVADRRMVLLRMLILLGWAPDTALAATDGVGGDGTERIPYSGKHVALCRFVHRHGKLLERITSARNEFDPDALPPLLRAASDIVL